MLFRKLSKVASTDISLQVLKAFSLVLQSGEIELMEERVMLHYCTNDLPREGTEVYHFQRKNM